MITNGSDTNTQVYIYKQILPRYINDLRVLIMLLVFVFYINCKNNMTYTNYWYSVFSVYMSAHCKGNRTVESSV